MGQKRAAQGQGCEPAKISKMLGLLKYQAVSGKDQDKKADATHALAIYNELSDPEERKSFLTSFEANGGGKGKDALKFSYKFKQSLTSQRKTESSLQENHFTRYERYEHIMVLLI